MGTTSTSVSVPPAGQLGPQLAEPGDGGEHLGARGRRRRRRSRSPPRRRGPRAPRPAAPPARWCGRRARGPRRAGRRPRGTGPGRRRRCACRPRAARRPRPRRRPPTATVNGPAATGHGDAAITDSTSRPSATERAKVETQSMVGLAGTTPSVGRVPGAPFSPTTPHMRRRAPGRSRRCRCRARTCTWPSATATAEPDEDPPGMSAGSNGLRGRAVGRAGAHQAGGELVEVGLAHVERAGGLEPGRRPWPSRSRGAGRSGQAGRGDPSGHVDVVLHRERHAPQRVAGARRVDQRLGRRRAGASAGSTSIQIAGSPQPSMRARTSSTTATGSSPAS